MPRYIDADELRHRVKEKTNPYGKPIIDYESGVKVMNMIDNAPTADVVPKSEVEEAEAEIERLKHILDCYALQYGTVKEQQDVIDKANQEVASEIFEEIDILGTYNPTLYAELKKKYTEGEQ